MGDLSTEPSMEEILSSIKRIIAEEGDQPARRARPARPGAALPVNAAADRDDEVLELSEPLPAPARPEPRASPVVEPAEPPRSFEPVKAPEPIVSQEAAAASRAPLEALSRLMTRPEPGSDGTLEGLVREMLRPMLREWLDAHLPQLVEMLVSREIERIATQAQ